MMSMLNLLWIVPLVASVAWVFGYNADHERVKAFVKRHIVDDDPFESEDHSATRYTQEEPEDIKAARLVYSRNPYDYDDVNTGICEGIESCSHCFRCSGDGHGKTSTMVKEDARRFLIAHGINPDEANA